MKTVVTSHRFLLVVVCVSKYIFTVLFFSFFSIFLNIFTEGEIYDGIGIGIETEV